MAAINFGYTISKPRAIDIDRNNLRKSDEILREMPELQTCIGCGACTAVCTAGNLTEFNFRKVHTLVRRGEYQGAYEEMNKCMLCGKCRLVCPRGINTRGVVMLIKRKLGISDDDFLRAILSAVHHRRCGDVRPSWSSWKWGTWLYRLPRADIRINWGISDFLRTADALRTPFLEVGDVALPPARADKADSVRTADAP